jgi:hypothetical protein
MKYKYNKVCVKSRWGKLQNPDKKIELNKWSDSPYSWIGRLNIVKMLVLSNLIFNFNEIPVNYLWILTNWFLSLFGEKKRPRIIKSVLKNKVGGLTLPDFKTYYQVTVIKIVCTGKQINKCINEQNKGPRNKTT